MSYFDPHRNDPPVVMRYGDPLPMKVTASNYHSSLVIGDQWDEERDKDWDEVSYERE